MTTTLPGLDAWETRRQNSRRRTWHCAILVTGLAGMALYATPADYNPLVHAGILIVPELRQDEPIRSLTLSIPIRSDDLPKKRPSLADARAADAIEAAQINGVLPAEQGASAPTAINAATAAGSASIGTDSVLSNPESVAVELLAPMKPAAATLPRRPAVDKATSSVVEDFDTMRLRTFDAGR